MVRWIQTGLSRGLQHKKLVLLLFLLSALPVLAWVLVAAPVLMEGLASRPLADHLLDARILETFLEYAGSEEFNLGPILGAVPILMLAVWFLQVFAAAGYVPALLGGETRTAISFAEGVRRFSGRFLRSALAFGIVLGGLLLLFAGGMAAGAALVEKTSNELVGLRVTAFMIAFAGIVFAPLDLAYDLSRVAAVAHDGRQTFRGYFRCLRWVLRRPGSLMPFYLLLALLALGAAALHFGLRSLWNPLTIGGILLLMLLRQSLMVVRCYVQLSFWGAEAACYEDYGSPDFCRGQAAPRSRGDFEAAPVPLSSPVPAPAPAPEPALASAPEATAVGMAVDAPSTVPMDAPREAMGDAAVDEPEPWQPKPLG